MHDQIKVIGHVIIKKYDEAGEIIKTVEINNLVVATGKNFIAARLSGTPPTPMSHLAIGAPSTAIAALSIDTTLNAEIARIALSTLGGVVSANNVSYSATFPPGIGTSDSIAEAGIFSAAVNGTLLCRTTFSAITKLATETIVVSWTITIS